MNQFLDYLIIVLLAGLLIPLGVFLWWNWQYRHLGNGFRTMRLTIQHWTSSLFFILLYLFLRRIAVDLGWNYPAVINQFISIGLFAYMIVRTWTSLLTFKKIRDGELNK